MVYQSKCHLRLDVPWYHSYCDGMFHGGGRAEGSTLPSSDDAQHKKRIELVTNTMIALLTSGTTGDLPAS
jgi:hypothetical protein